MIFEEHIQSEKIDYINKDYGEDFLYVKIDYSIYLDINDIPMRNDELLLDQNTFPKMVVEILDNEALSDNAIEKFFRKFYVTYVTDKEFRILTNNLYFLFVNDDYIGIYSKSQLMMKCNELREQNNNILFYIFSLHHDHVIYTAEEIYNITVEKVKQNLNDNIQIDENIEKIRVESHNYVNKKYETKFPYIPLDYYNLYDLNETPIRNDEIDIILEALPSFMEHLLIQACIKPEEKEKFFRKFCITYLTDIIFRRIVDDCTFLFIGGKYHGVYKTIGEADTIGTIIVNKNNLDESFYLSEMYYDLTNISYEFTETAISIAGSKILQVKIDEKYYPVRKTESFTLDISYGIKQNETSELISINENEEFTFDTGATYGHVMFEEYINSDYKYSNYPFDENNDLVVDENFKKDELLRIAKNMKKYSDETVIIGDGIKSSRKIIHFSDYSYVIINKKLKLKISNLLCRELVVKIKNNNVSKLFGFLKVENSTKRVKNVPKRLFGMDLISQLNSTITCNSTNLSTLTLSYPLVSLSSQSVITDEDFKNIYEVYLFRSDLTLYSKYNTQYVDIMYNNYYLSLNKLFDVEPDCDEAKKYKNNKTLNLLVTNGMEIKLIQFIYNSHDIDGWIKKVPGGHLIWIKNNNFTVYEDAIIRSIENSSNYEEELQSFNKYHVATWNINFFKGFL